MKTIYLQSRSELSAQMKRQTKIGCTCYRVRTACNCHERKTPKKDTKPQTGFCNPEMYPKANQRNGVLVIENDVAVCMFIQCKACARASD
jgi:hypothetical protein